MLTHDNVGKARAWGDYVALLLVFVLAALTNLSLTGGKLEVATLLQEKTTTELAAVIGIAGAVPPNEFNSLALQLSEKEKILTARETALAIREEALAPENQALTIIVLYGAIAIILLLLFLNFYLDWRRASRPSDLPHENNRVIHLS